jgi:hypothetical protein
VTFILRNIFFHGPDFWVFFINQCQRWIHVSYLEPRTNTTSRRRLRWRRSSTTRRSLTTASSTSGSSPRWPHAPLCTVSSGAAAAWTRSRTVAPRCPSSNRGTSWSSRTPVTLGLFWAPHPTTAPSRRPAHHLKSNLPRKLQLIGHEFLCVGTTAVADVVWVSSNKMYVEE